MSPKKAALIHLPQTPQRQQKSLSSPSRRKSFSSISQAHRDTKKAPIQASGWLRRTRAKKGSCSHAFTGCHNKQKTLLRGGLLEIRVRRRSCCGTWGRRSWGGGDGVWRLPRWGERGSLALHGRRSKPARRRDVLPPALPRTRAE